MALSAAARVNEKLYHAGLLWQLAGDQQETESAADAARLLALQHAAVNALYTALQLFLQEVAESAKLRQPVETLQQLQDAFSKEGRSHAVAATLNVLANDAHSWLSALLKAQQATLFDDAADTPNADPLAVKIVGDTPMPVPQILTAFRSFVMQQRDYLQEW